MLKEKELRNFKTNMRCVNKITLEDVKNTIESKAHMIQLPVAFYNEEIKKGGMLNSHVIDCLVVYHPEHHSDYIKFAISIENSVVSISEFGESKNQRKLNNRQGAGAAMKAGIHTANINAEKGSGIGGALTTGALIGGVKILKSLGGSKVKKQAEEEYYSMLISILNEIIYNLSES